MKRHVRVYLSKEKIEEKEGRERGRVKEIGVERGEERGKGGGDLSKSRR